MTSSSAAKTSWQAEPLRAAPGVCDHLRLPTDSFIYCFPTVLENERGRIAVDAALACLATELELGDGIKLRQGNGSSIVVTGIEPADLWRAMDRAVPDWEDRDLFFPPVFM